MLTFTIVFVLIALSALLSGLTIGLLSLGPHELKRKIDLGDSNAKKIYPIRKRGNLLLVTLCLANTAVNAALSIFLGTIAPGIVAGVLSTALITVFGEIAPTAVFSRFAMELGARSAGLTKLLLIVLYPICAPIAWVLNKALGEELPTIYSKNELVQILEEHSSSNDSDVKGHEERIARGALTYGEKKISDVMSPRSMIVSVREDEYLSAELIAKLSQHGYSRYPVFDTNKEQLVGILYMYKLVAKDFHDAKISDICDKKINFLNADENLDHALDAFLKTKHHLYGVVNSFGEVVGVLTIEDVLEEIIGKEIIDEFDEYDNVRAVVEKQKIIKRKV